ncbi:MAG: DNA-binding protein [Myxococcales bacterium]|nr:DNA-binding protein [Myxococcales bacterium]
MHKSDLIKKVAEATDVSNKDAESVINNAIDTIIATVAAGEKVVLTGFGTLERKKRKARKGRHPSTGKEITIPEKWAVSFSAGKIFKETVEKG